MATRTAGRTVCTCVSAASPLPSMAALPSAAVLRRSSGVPKFPPSAQHRQHRYSSSKSGSATGERDVPPSGPNSGFSDAIVSDVVGGAGDANSAGSTGTPASPSVPTDRKSYMPTAEWLNSEEGRKYRRPQSGRPNWLGRTPFPLNPTFKPPTPISNAQKERIYRAFVDSLENAKATASAASSTSSGSGTGGTPKSETFHLRQLSLQFGLSIDRVRAIVRLKALEKNFAAQGTQLQIAFLSGMEQALGVSTGKQLSIREPADVAKETRQMYGVGRKTRYIMLDEENVEDVEDVEKELERRERRKAKGEGEQPDTAVELQESDPDSIKYIRANVQKTLKANRKVELQFKDVPSTASSSSASGDSSNVQQ